MVITMTPVYGFAADVSAGRTATTTAPAPDAISVTVGEVTLSNGDYTTDGKTKTTGTLPAGTTSYASFSTSGGPVLTLNNFIYTGAGTTQTVSGNTFSAAIYADGNLTINSKGESTISNIDSNTSNFRAGIICHSANNNAELTTIGSGMGAGKCTFKVVNEVSANKQSIGIFGDKIIINNTTVWVSSGAAPSGISAGIYTNDVTLTGTKPGLSATTQPGANSTQAGVYVLQKFTIDGTYAGMMTHPQKDKNGSKIYGIISKGDVEIKKSGSNFNIIAGQITSSTENDDSIGIKCEGELSVAPTFTTLHCTGDDKAITCNTLSFATNVAILGTDTYTTEDNSSTMYGLADSCYIDRGTIKTFNNKNIAKSVRLQSGYRFEAETPSEITVNGITAKVKFDKLSPYLGSSTVTGTVTLTGTAKAAGTHTIDFTSATASLNSNPKTKDVTAGETLTASTTYTFPFSIGTADIEDLTLTHTSTASGSSGGSSGGGTGGSSGGGTVSPPAPVEEVKVTTPADGTNNPTLAEVTLAGQQGANGTLGADNMDQLIDKAITAAENDANQNNNMANGIEIAIILEGGADRTELDINLSKESQEKILDKKVKNTTLTATNPGISIDLDLQAIQNINGQAKSDVNIKATKVNPNTLGPDAEKILANRPTFHVAFSYDQQKEIIDLGDGMAEITIPYVPAEGEKPAQLQVVYIDKDGNVQRITGPTFDKENNEITVVVNKLSTLGIGYITPSSKVGILKAKSEKGRASLRWSRATNEPDGYRIYRSATKDGKYKPIAWVKNGKAKTYKEKAFKSNKSYYYKVRAYKQVNGKCIWGAYSPIKLVKF